MRALGIDLGSKRIGLAVSDAGGVLASPFATIERTKDTAALHRRLAAIVADEEVEIVVVGLPLGLDGKTGRAAEAATAEAVALADVLPVPVVTHDERLTTVTAHQQLQRCGCGRAPPPPDRRPAGRRRAPAVLARRQPTRGSPAPDGSP